MGTIIGIAAIGIGVIFVLIYITAFIFVSLVGNEKGGIIAIASLIPAGWVALYYTVFAVVVITVIAILNVIFSWGL